MVSSTLSESDLKEWKKEVNQIAKAAGERGIISEVIGITNTRLEIREMEDKNKKDRERNLQRDACTTEVKRCRQLLAEEINRMSPRKTGKQ